MNKKILLVDDEPDILELIGYNLRREGYDVFTAENGKQGIDMARSVNPDLIILDVMMPEMDGMEVCNIIRSDAKLSHTTIAFLTARGEDYSQVAGFDAGGDDYITKPVKPKVLVSRVKASLRRSVPTRPSCQMSGSASPLTWTGSPFCRKEKSSPCPKRNLNCSICLVKPGKVFTREAILSAVWGNDVVVGDRTIDVHIRKLRSKLGDGLFTTVKGVGYKFGK